MHELGEIRSHFIGTHCVVPDKKNVRSNRLDWRVSLSLKEKGLFIDVTLYDRSFIPSASRPIHTATFSSKLEATPSRVMIDINRSKRGKTAGSNFCWSWEAHKVLQNTVIKMSSIKKKSFTSCFVHDRNASTVEVFQKRKLVYLNCHFTQSPNRIIEYDKILFFVNSGYHQWNQLIEKWLNVDHYPLR